MITGVSTGPIRRAVPESAVPGALVAVVAIVVLLFVAPVPARAAQTGEGLEVSSSTYYDPQPGSERVRVDASFTLTNRQPDEIVGDQVRSFFYTRWLFAVPAVVTDLSATSDGVPLEVAIEAAPDSEDIVFASIRLPYDLQYEQSIRIDASYTIPGSLPRVEGSIARVNDSFLSFAVWTAGDPGQAEVRVRIPSGFRIDLQGSLDELQEVERNGETTLEALSIARPKDFFGQVFGRNDAGLITAHADLPEARATVRAWPDDPEWAEFVVAAIEEDVPVMAELIGLDWTMGDIEVIETVTPYLFGYGGWFNASSGLIEIGETLERDLILHELSHAWFNDALIDGRWIIEGLAEEFASRTMEATGDVRPDPTEPDPDDPVRVPLAAWASPWTLPEEDAYAYEQYHYNASWWVMRQITDEIGLDRLADVLADLDADRLTYPGERAGERTTEPTSWTHLFDLLDEHYDDVRLDELFTTHVLDPVDAAQLAPRRAARQEYGELVAMSGSWSPPVVVRRDLAAWRFDHARQAMEAASAVVKARDSVDSLADALGLAIEHSNERRYEDATTIAALGDALDEEFGLLDELAGLQQERTSLVQQADRLQVSIVFDATTPEDAAAEVIDVRRGLLELERLRTTVESRAAAAGVSTPAWGAGGQSDVDAALALARARLATLEAIEKAAAAIEEPRSAVERLGLLRNDPDALLDDARRAFETDRLDVALAATAAAEDALAGASSAGTTRLGWVGAGLAVVFVVGLGFVSLRRRSRRTRGRRAVPSEHHTAAG